MNMNPLPQKLRDGIEPLPPSGCWVWTGAVNNRGYASLYIGGRVQLAHRVAYEAVFGAIPRGLTVDHLCRVRSCVNPAHMELVTLRENILRGGSFAARLAKRKACPKCGGPFERNASARYCRPCYNARQRSYMTTYRPDHVADRAAYMKVWRAANPDRIRAYAATQKAKQEGREKRDQKG